MHPLLTVQYWFNIRAIPFLPVFERILLVFFAAFVIAGIASSLMQLVKSFSKETRRAFGKLGNHLTWTGLIGLLFWTFTWQGIPILSMKMFFVLWAIWFVWGFYPIYTYLFIEVPEKNAMRQEREVAEKWLPKKK